MRNTYANWSRRMQDSLKIDSIAKKVSPEGAQMVRDSIKTASKLK